MISIILVKPKKSGNLGAVARVMANFGFKDLILVNPKCKKNSIEARKRAKHAQAILKSAKVLKNLPKLHTLIATTSQIGTDYNIPRSPISPEQLNTILPKIKNNKKQSKNKIALVFGPEGEGLSNDEVKKCDFVLTIPTAKKYPVLNLSHSVAILLYELSKTSKTKKVSEHFVLAKKTEKDQLMKMLNSAMKKMNFKDAKSRETQRKVWKRMISKSFLTKREAFALMGFLRKLI